MATYYNAMRNIFIYYLAVLHFFFFFSLTFVVIFCLLDSNNSKYLLFVVLLGISGDMERHELKHTGERPFSCDQCSETFTRLQYLREHQNTHQGRRPYKCVFCGLSFHDFASCRHHVSKHKVTEEKQPAQQIHVEVTPDVSGFSCVCGWVGACAYMFCVHVHVYV